MSLAPSETAAAPASATLAVVCVAVWLAAAASSGRFGIWPAIGGAAVVLGIAILALDAASRGALRPSPSRVLIGLAVGGAMSATTWLLYPLLIRIAPPMAGDTAALYAAFRGPSPLVASLALAPVILGEELVWRGVVQAALVRRVGPWAGAALAALVYALVHAPLGSPVLMLVALSGGLVWGALRATTGSLVPPLLAHLLWDVLVLWCLPLDGFS